MIAAMAPSRTAGLSRASSRSAVMAIFHAFAGSGLAGRQQAIEMRREPERRRMPLR